ncbi:hypothetical protein PM035_12950 [Halorubrum ezzemoulense]|uniref:hypothetical protein n=1 Tax=Halorubrum ezzemoulense TaxID=337243 RepID=UPI00232DC1D8|nr:hypothetical protein [Halorubrum ezzemoulense]MDB2262339.1 hypothetical protein [Halorubrum ezzemoulense]MDB2268596.1 hypothetical protein [Halorubrum ezzemoulense]
MGDGRWGALVHHVVVVPTFVAAFWLFRLSSLPGLPVTVAVAGLGYVALRATGRRRTGEGAGCWCGWATRCRSATPSERRTRGGSAASSFSR